MGRRHGSGHDEATKRGWTMISMKRDWKRLLAFQP
jgi:hypothetical protein